MKMISTLASLTALFGLISAQDTHRFSSVRINNPPDLKDQFPDGVENMPAMFGLPFAHQGRITGELLTPRGGRNDEVCEDFSEETKAEFRNIEKSAAVIAVAHRGDCTFVTKVRHVQELGAQAAIIIDNINEGGIPYMADDGQGGSITIPSVLVNKRQGDKIYDAVEAAMDVIDDRAEYAKLKVIGTITFNIPRPDNRVEWTMWASSGGNNEDGLADFKRQWGPVGKALGEFALLTPHYFFMNGTFQGCQTADHLCRNQCTNDGRYCDVDPDGDLGSGVAGANVVRENLRQICYWKTLNATGDISNYWTYMNEFFDNCYEIEMEGGHDIAPWEDCSFNLMKKLSGDDMMKQTKKCIDDSGGYQEDSGVNTIMEEEITVRKNMNIILRPAILVNEQKFIGSVACPNPQSPSTCGVFGAICNGFANSSQVPACDPIPDPDCDLGVKKDECGVCGGNSTAEMCASSAAGGSSGSGGSVEDKNGVSAGVVIAIALICLVIVAGGVFCYLKRREDAMKEDIDNLLKQYLPMQDGAATTNV